MHIAAYIQNDARAGRELEVEIAKATWRRMESKTEPRSMVCKSVRRRNRGRWWGWRTEETASEGESEEEVRVRVETEETTREGESEEENEGGMIGGKERRSGKRI